MRSPPGCAPVPGQPKKVTTVDRERINLCLSHLLGYCVALLPQGNLGRGCQNRDLRARLPDTQLEIFDQLLADS
jgi:hypothetical protein